MKKPGLFFSGLVLLSVISTFQLGGQEAVAGSNFNVGTDFYSSYIWRGSKFGQGPSLQPYLELSAGGLAVGVWGSFDAFGYTEADPYISYSFPFGLSIGLTDYYYPGLEFFDLSTATGSHAFEVNGGFETGGLSLSANYIINEAGGAASTGGDLYFEAGYSFPNLDIFIGAGDGWHTSDGEFNFCNIGVGTSRDIAITDRFSLPLSGQIILNPDKEQLYVIAGFSF
jgi:hypothetical protein